MNTSEPDGANGLLLRYSDHQQDTILPRAEKSSGRFEYLEQTTFTGDWWPGSPREEAGPI